MVTRVVRHAVFAYVDPEGVNRLALRGESIEVDGDELARGERFEALAADEAALVAELAAIRAAEEGEESPAEHSATLDEDNELGGDPGSTGEEVESARPPRTAAKEAWVDFAVAHGAARGEAEAMTKADLIAAFGD